MKSLNSLEECSLNGQIYAPALCIPRKAAINKTYVEKTGIYPSDTLTWDFIWEVSKPTAKDADIISLTDGPSWYLLFTNQRTTWWFRCLSKDAGYASANGISTFQRYYHTASVHHRGQKAAPSPPSKYPVICQLRECRPVCLPWFHSRCYLDGEQCAPFRYQQKKLFVDFETEVMMIPQFDPGIPDDLPKGPSVCVFNRRIPRRSGFLALY